MQYKKKDLSRRFSIDSGLKRDEARKVANAFLYSFRAFLSEMEIGDRLEIRDFGVFEMHMTKGRMSAVDPKFQQRHIVAARRRLRFKPSITLKRELRKLQP